jgi:uncharacterized membrane protein
MASPICCRLSFAIIIGILIAGAVGALIYTITSPVHERCTEFSILGLYGEADKQCSLQGLPPPLEGR